MSLPPDRVGCAHVGLEYLATAPLRVVVSEEIDTTPAGLFDIFLDAGSWSRWAFPITGVEWTSPFPIGVGSTRCVTMRGGMVGWEEFLAWESGRRMAFRFNETVKGGPVAFAEDYHVTELGSGRCRLEWTMALTLTGVSERMTPLIRPAMKLANRQMLRKLRSYAATDPLR